MKKNRISPQAVATSLQMTARIEDVRSADNFRNLFEVPVLFYALMAVALALSRFPLWLVVGAWLFVILRIVHSIIHCTYNRVMHRFTAFAGSFGVIVALWVTFFFTLPQSL